MQDLPSINLIRAELCKRSFYHFFKEFWEVMAPDTPFVPNWHIKYICDEVQQVAERAINGKARKYDLIINVPPGSSKSSIVSVALPAWLWTIAPSTKLITGSNAQSLSLVLAVKSRDIIESDKYAEMFPNVKMKDDVNNKAMFGTTDGGVRLSTSVKSTIIGHHARVLIVDDPLPLNPTSLDISDANEWVDTLSTRKDDKKCSVLILIMQRLAEVDTTAHLLRKRAGTKLICLPATLLDNVEPVALREQYVDGLLDPIRMSHNILADTKANLGSVKYEAQFLQNPSPAGGGIIKDDWVRRLTGAPEEVLNLPVHFFIDGAYTANHENDPSAILAAAHDAKSNTLYILKVCEFWMEWNEIVKFIQNFVKKFGDSASMVYIEPKANGLSLQQYLKSNTTLNIPKTISPKSSKDDRLSSVSPYIEGGKVIFIDENSTFEGIQVGSKDELIHEITHQKPAKYGQRDTLVMAIQELISKKQGRYVPKSKETGSRRYTVR